MIVYPGKKIFERDCFVHNGNYYATKISVYDNGNIECWGLMDKQEFLAKTKSGWITVDIPDGTGLRICDQDFVVNQEKTLNPDGSLMFIHKWITQESFIQDVLDAVHVAHGNKSASELCYEAYEGYLSNPSIVNRNKLEQVYLDVPSHNRQYILGNQDVKDFPIRNILGI
jgi:hypothetical protein